MAEILPINFLDYLSMHTKIDLRVLATSTHGHDSDMLLTADAMQQENLGASNLSKTWYSKTSLIQKTGLVLWSQKTYAFFNATKLSLIRTYLATHR